MENTTKYESVAGRMQQLIEEGTLRPGDRIPSVRHLHRQWSVSMTTVLEAYRLLEDRGWVEARPRSGYYVRPNPLALVREPVVTDPPRRPQRVRTDLMMRMHAEMNNPDIVRLGAAAPDLDLLPYRVLARKVTEALRRHPQTCHTYMTGPGHDPLRREIARRMWSRRYFSSTVLRFDGTTGAFIDVFIPADGFRVNARDSRPARCRDAREASP